MIEKITIFKKNGHMNGVEIRYANGGAKNYSFNNMPQTAMNFILREDVKAFENEWCIWYKEVA